jgi:peptidoglycan/LPS O-acetylase OafA/YrhL
MKLRGDIQALRGWAVWLVLLDHADITPVQHGYLGVDIFFVISGYLITTILAESISNGTFQFRDFYFRRARRILPAAYATIALTAVASIYFLTSLEMESFGTQVLGAITFTINFVLWEQTDYFAIGSNLKPLLHLWSLAVEEQYYVLLPAVMFLIPPRYWRGLTVGVFIASFALYLWWVQRDPTGAFYMLPTRAWELTLGSLGAVFRSPLQQYQRLWTALFWPSVVSLVLAPLVSFGSPHPGIQALVVCTATLAIILAKNEWVASTLLVTPLARMGDVSYSLYLVHWPIMVFTYCAYLGEVPLSARLMALALSVALAVLLYRFVEQPARRAFHIPSLRFAGVGVAASITTVGVYFLSAAYARGQSEFDFAEVRAKNYGLDAVCDRSGGSFGLLKECRTAEEPEILVWGDSYAMHLVPGIIAETDKGVIQATFSSCPPVLGYAPKDIARAPESARRCIKFNEDVLRYLAQAKSIKTVVLGSPWRIYTSAGAEAMTVGEGDRLVSRKAGMKMAIEGMGETIRAIKRLEKRVIVFGPPPRSDSDSSACVERHLAGKVVLGAPNECSIDKAKALWQDRHVIQVLDAVEDRYDVEVVRISDELCGESDCRTMVGHVPVYRDAGHLSSMGSKMVMKHLHFGRKL